MHTLNSLEALMHSNPDEFIRLLNSGEVEPYILTYAAENAGQLPLAVCLETLNKLSTHSHILVREGAIYGLACHSEDERVQAILDNMAQNDTHHEIRKLAEDVLDDD